MTLESLWARIGAQLYDPFLALGERRGMAARRRELLAGVSGRVLEIGAGTGLNLAAYPLGAEVVTAEPDAAMCARLRARGAPRVVQAKAEALPFDDASFDVVVSTLVLCTVGDPGVALREARRVLRPDGRLVFIEHVRAEDARWQDRLARPWSMLALGCRCNQPTLALIGGEFRLGAVRSARWRGMPPIVAPLVIGEARP